MTIHRRSIHINHDAQSWNSQDSSLQDVRDFHRQLPGYKPTRLVSLDDLASKLGIKKLYVKDEGDRLGLPSFKILGASWGTYRAVTEANGIAIGASLEEVKEAVAKNPQGLFAATDGNHGRAVSRMAKLLGLNAYIYVPAAMDLAAMERIREEGAKVIETGKSYDDAILEAQKGADVHGGLLIQDCAFPGYEVLPQWIVDGYSTSLHEVDEQLGSETADFVFVPTGVGSLAQAVVSHYRRKGSPTKVVTVEADTAACLHKSLRQGISVAIDTTPTIMSGLDCGTVSTISWPILQAGTGASVTVADEEAHEAVVELEAHGVLAGPCGASGLAALRRLSEADRSRLALSANSTAVLLCTEKKRPYEMPLRTRTDDLTDLTDVLRSINLHTDERKAHKTKELDRHARLAQYIFSWFEHRDITCSLHETSSGRPVVTASTFTGLNGHTNGVQNGIANRFEGIQEAQAASCSTSLLQTSKDEGEEVAKRLAQAMLELARAKTIGSEAGFRFPERLDREQ